MVVKPKTGWLWKLFWIHGTTLEETWPRIIVTTAIAVAVTVADLWLELDEYSLTTTPFVLIGVALSILLGFRNSAAYDRWWEGRKLWGGMVNITRSFARQVTVYLEPPPRDRDGPEGAADDPLRAELILRTIAYVHALRHHLRVSSPWADLERILSTEATVEIAGRRNVPIAILEGTGRRLRDACREGRLSDFRLTALERSLTEMTDLQGGCERIRNTPMPFSYTVLTHRLVVFYCFTLPFGLVSTTGLLTPLVVLLISHAFYGLDALGDEIEDPFGMEANDLPLAAICRTIEIDLRQTLGEGDVPEPATPQAGVLL